VRRNYTSTKTIEAALDLNLWCDEDEAVIGLKLCRLVKRSAYLTAGTEAKDGEIFAMKIAFVIVAHKFPEQIVRLIRSLSPEAHYFIHIDRRAKAVFTEAQRLLENTPNVFLVEKRYPCYWGQFNIVNATLECLRTISKKGEKYDYAVLISGQDYPIKPVSEIKLFLERNRGRQFIEAFPLMEPNRWTNQDGAYQATRRVLNWHFFFRSHRIHLPLQREIPNSLVPYGGSQWWALTRECVDYLIDYVDTHPNVVNYFKNTFIPDELFFQTLVCNSPFRREVSGYSLSYVNWLNPNPTSPRVLTTEDFEALRKSDCLFARKFDPNRSEKLLKLVDQKLLNAERLVK